MNKNFMDTVYLFSCAARGIEPKPLSSLDFDSIYKIAKSQGIWETVFLSVKYLNNSGHQITTPEIYKELNNKFIMCCAVQYRKQEFVHIVIDKLKSEGVECCVLKGESIARLYNTPIARISSDVDLLINSNDTPKCLEVLKELGFNIGDKVYESHQIECMHPISGLVEIHTQMYGNKTNDVSFNNEIKYTEEYTTFETEDGRGLYTLGITDNALFLLMHFIKHFLSAGAGIRQICDFLLYIEHYYDKIDWGRVSAILEKLSFKYIFDCIIFIGEKYFHFPDNLFEKKDIDEKLIDKIFEDIQIGGMFGHDDEQRNGFYDLYLQCRYTRFNRGNYSTYVGKRKMARLFPNRKFMSINYPYVNKTVFFMPIAWGHRIFNGVIKNKNKRPINKKQEERMQLLEDLKMI